MYVHLKDKGNPALNSCETYNVNNTKILGKGSTSRYWKEQSIQENERLACQSRIRVRERARLNKFFVGSDVFIDPLHLLAHIEYTYLLGYTWSVYVLSILEGLAIHLTDRDHNYKFGARQPKLFVINYNLGDSIHIWNFKYILLNCHVNSLNKINSAYKMWV